MNALAAACLAFLFCQPAWPAAAERYPSASVYRLNDTLTNQDGKSIHIDVHAGQPVLIAMFYGSCQATCPVIIETVRAIERGLEPSRRERLRVLLVSFDAVRDTPDALRALAAERHIDTSRWTLAHAEAPAVRRIAAALGVQYKQLPNGDYSHANVITALSAQGEMLGQSSTLTRADPVLIAALSSAD